MSLVETDLDDGVLTVTLADEERRNVLSRELTTELVAALDAADADPGVRVVVLTNRGSVFCAGANLAERSPSTADPGPTDAINPLALFGRFRHSRSPTWGGSPAIASPGDGSRGRPRHHRGAAECEVRLHRVRVGVAPAMISVVCLPKMRLGDAQAAFLRGNASVRTRQPGWA